MARSLKLHVVGCRGCRDNGAVASSGTRLGAKLSFRPYRSIRQAAVGRETCVRVGEYAPHPVVTTCWSADIARQMTTCFGMDEGLDWRKRRSDRDFLGVACF